MYPQYEISKKIDKTSLFFVAILIATDKQQIPDPDP